MILLRPKLTAPQVKGIGGTLRKGKAAIIQIAGCRRYAMHRELTDPTKLSIYGCTYRLIYSIMFIYLSIYLSIYSSIYLSMYLSI